HSPPLVENLSFTLTVGSVVQLTGIDGIWTMPLEPRSQLVLLSVTVATTVLPITPLLSLTISVMMSLPNVSTFLTATRADGVYCLAQTGDEAAEPSGSRSNTF